jgi:hypothetical protein
MIALGGESVMMSLLGASKVIPKRIQDIKLQTPQSEFKPIRYIYSTSP